MIEIERKFLVENNNFKEQAYSVYSIKQGFLNTDPNRTVRVRLKDDDGFITVKGLSSKNGVSRFEWEKPISKEDAIELLKLCEETIIEKFRYTIKVGHHIFEVDEFFGLNLGLIVAEVELKFENEFFESPKWLGKEVTGDSRYYNSSLSKDPFTMWKK